MERIYRTIEEKMKSHSPLVVAIDGGAASGKTTLAAALADRFHGAVIHMDDFFLRPEQRTEERLREIGGNLDRERLLREVIPYLHAGKAFSYRRFDCASMTLGETVAVSAAPLIVAEGSYSHHPALREAWDLTVFLDVDEQTRKARILLRNGEEKLRVFCEKWIPMENRYFEGFDIKKLADIIVRG